MPLEKRLPSKAIDWHSFGLHEQEDGTVNLEMPPENDCPRIQCSCMRPIDNIEKFHKMKEMQSESTSDCLNKNECETWDAKLRTQHGKQAYPITFFSNLDHSFGNFDRLSLTFARLTLCFFIGACFLLSLYALISEIRENRVVMHQNLLEQCSHRTILIRHMINQSLAKVEASRSLIKTFHENHPHPQVTQASFCNFLNQSILGFEHVTLVNYVQRVPKGDALKFARKDSSQMFMNGSFTMDNSSLYSAPILFSYSPPTNPQSSNSPNLHQVAVFQNLTSRVNDSEAFYISTLKYESVVRIAVLLPVSSQGLLLGWIYSEVDIRGIVEKVQSEFSKDRRRSNIWLYDLTDSLNPIELFSSSDEAGVTDLNQGGNPKIKGEKGLDVRLVDDGSHYVSRCSAGSADFPWRALNWVLALIFMLCGFYGLFYFINVKKKIHELSESFETMRYLRDHAQKAKQAAENADASKSQFLATISHEIRTPLNGVIGMLSLLRETKLDATQLDYVQTAVSSGKALISLINDVLDFSKIEAGKMEIEYAPFDLRAEVEDVVVLFAEMTRTKGIELGVLIQHSLPGVLVGDSARFRQVLINLIGNATKFTDEGHILVSIFQLDEEDDLEVMHHSFRTDLKSACSSQQKSEANPSRVSNQSIPTQSSAHKRSNSITCGRSLIDEDFSTGDEEKGSTVDQRYETFSGCLTASALNTHENVAIWMVKPLVLNNEKTIRLAVSVEDTGQGVPLDAQERIFQPFKQADSGTFRRSGGTGIGLSISKRLVELMGGKLGFVSTPSIGSTFFFDIRFQLNDDPAQANHARLIRGDSIRGQSIIIQSGLNHTCTAENSQKQRLMGNHVLVIDSQPLRARVLAYHLRSMGITCDFTQSASRAMQLLEEFQMMPTRLTHATSLSPEAFKSNLSGLHLQMKTGKGLESKRGGSGTLIGRTSSGSLKMEDDSLPMMLRTSDKRRKYSAVFVDADSSLWDDRGLEFGKLARKNIDTNEVPFILISQKLDAAFSRCAIKSGYSSVLPKPLRRASISFALSKALKIDLNLGNSESKNPNSEILTNLLKGKRVMCVDDNLVNRRVASKLLSKFGVETLCMEGGSEAVDYIHEHIEIDMILMDIQMPGMDGYEAARKIREFEGQINSADSKRNVYSPIIAMTADVLKGTREKCLAAGMDGYLTKPIDPSELSRTVAKFFTSKSNAASLSQAGLN